MTSQHALQYILSGVLLLPMSAAHGTVLRAIEYSSYLSLETEMNSITNYCIASTQIDLRYTVLGVSYTS